jgi:hypothetical protein
VAQRRQKLASAPAPHPGMPPAARALECGGFASSGRVDAVRATGQGARRPPRAHGALAARACAATKKQKKMRDFNNYLGKRACALRPLTQAPADLEGNSASATGQSRYGR